MATKNVPGDVVKELARRRTVASARLENREVPEGFVRSSKVEQYLQVDRTQTS